MALIWTVALVLIVAAVLASGTEDLRALDTVTKTQFVADAQSRAVAEAGLVDAYAWFRRQTVQPVTTFAPQLDPAAVPPINDTEDPSLGLARSFEISPDVWGRYVVRLGVEGEPFEDTNDNGLYDPGEPYTDQNGDGRHNPPQGTRDITRERGIAGTGIVWRLESLGRIYHRPRRDLPLEEAPNRIVGSALLATEIQRLPITPPVASAGYCSVGAKIDIGGRSRIRAPETALGYPEATGAPFVAAGAEILGASTAAPILGDRLVDVFGANLTDLQSMADISTDDPSTLPTPLPPYSLVVVDSDLAFDAARPLRGSGVLVVTGNLTLEPGSNSYYSGVIYAQGTMRLEAPAYLRGQVMAKQALELRGTSGDFVELEHDPGMVSRLLATMGHYRYSRAVFRPLPYHADGRPDRSFEGRPRGGGGGVGDGKGAEKDSDSHLPVWYRDHADEFPDLVAALDLMNEVVGREYGSELAEEVEEAFRDALVALQQLLMRPPHGAQAQRKIDQAIAGIQEAVADDGMDPLEAQEIVDLLELVPTGF